MLQISENKQSQKIRKLNIKLLLTKSRIYALQFTIKAWECCVIISLWYDLRKAFVNCCKISIHMSFVNNSALPYSG